MSSESDDSRLVPRLCLRLGTHCHNGGDIAQHRARAQSFDDQQYADVLFRLDDGVRARAIDLASSNASGYDAAASDSVLAGAWSKFEAGPWRGTMMLRVRLMTIVCVGLGLTASLPSGPTEAERYRLRRPIALALVDAGQRLIVANRDSGSIAIVDLASKRVAAEKKVGQRLADLSVSADGSHLLAIDETAGQMVALSRTGDKLREIVRRPTGLSPISVQRSADGKFVSIACLWPRRLIVFDATAFLSSTAAASSTIDLPFAPRLQMAIPETAKVIVADAFGGDLAVVDLERQSVESIRRLGVHNIRGLALDPSRKNLFLTHQFLNSTAATRREDIQNGNLLSNNVRKINLAALLGAPTIDDQIYSIGDIDLGAGDPAGIAADRTGRVLVALAGVNELGIGKLDEVVWTRIAVGRRPTALVFDDKSQRTYVANTFNDSISIVDCRQNAVVAEISLGAKNAELLPNERGEVLFHDARRSHAAWMSCQSCHPDGHTNGRLNDNFSDGSFGTSKRVLSLLGVKDTGPWAWNGVVADLETQVRTSFQGTMQGPRPSDDEVRDVTAYLRTLPPPPSLAHARDTLDQKAHERGLLVFEKLKCATCHKPPLYTTPRTYDVGLDASGVKYNPPSLRGASQGGPFFHDSRALTLPEVLSRTKHQLSEPLAPGDAADLLHFLNGL